ncbi:hypothetical protein [Chitinilyticum litopenaei]|uniref:hypothetical protein n=1 Tax=Chitinilyticum litopenaei TaxID=1121276 RepID=UPI001185F098|nr:hypothetical protein [Chitinilyticum litopenaei]
MDYFQIRIQPDSSTWKKYAAFDNDITNQGNAIDPNDAKTSLEYEIEIITNGELPEASSIGANFIILQKKLTPESILKSESIERITIIERTSKTPYIGLKAKTAIPCAKLELCEYEKWPTPHQLQPWDNPIGRIFIKPVIIKDKIPDNIDFFTIENWGGPFNIIASESIANDLKRIEKFSNLLSICEIKSV